MAQTPTWQAIHAIADAKSPAFRKLFAELVASARREMDAADIRRALERGDVAGAFESARRAFDAATTEWQGRIAGQLRDALDAAGLVTADTIPIRGRIAFTFDKVNPASVAWARDNAARLIRDITADTRLIIRSTILRSFEQGITADQTARALRGSIGLTTRMAQSVENYRAALVETGSSASVVDDAVARYSQKLINQRAETIARTEIMRASNQGQQDAWTQAIDRGFLTEHAVQVWIVTPDDRLCPICRPMKGQRKPIGQDFVSPTDGSRAKVPPIHPRCRCAIGIDMHASRERERLIA